jgi:cysteine-rich repeat protein
MHSGAASHQFANDPNRSNAVWYSYVLPPRQALHVGLAADFSGEVALIDARDTPCDALLQVPRPHVGFNASSSSVVSATNQGGRPTQLFLRVIPRVSTGTLALSVRVTDACDADDCIGMCGDAQVTGSEQCDDGNSVAGDGCSELCVREYGYGCAGEPSLCVPALPGDLCETAEPLIDGEFSLDGHVYESGCDVGGCSGSRRWWWVDVQPSEMLWVGLATNATVDGELALYPLERGTCEGSAQSPLARLAFGGPMTRLHAQHGVALGTGLSHPLRVAVVVTDRGNHPSSLSLRLSHKLSTSRCGNGARQPGWHGSAHCSATSDNCSQSEEGCDDANQVSGDGCDASCQTEAGWDCSSGPCVQPDCGDGVLHLSEECDDGGHADGDGCSADCHIEPGYVCPPSPAACAPYQPGDSCANADALADGDYAWNGYLADAHCPLLNWARSGDERTCQGVDRWFQITVPPGQTLAATVTTDSKPGRVQIIDVEAGCPRRTIGRDDAIADYAPRKPGRAYFRNTGEQPRRAAIAVSLALGEEASGGFALTHSLAPHGCGDGRVEWSSYSGQAERCDDGNTNNGDGCSSACAIEAGAACIGNGTRCAPSPAGDTSSTATPLADGRYDLSGYYVTDVACNTPYAVDRWFRLDVPAGQLAIVDIESHLPATIALRAACQQLDSSPVGNEGRGRVSWFNATATPASLLLVVAVEGDPGAESFTLASRTFVPACGDGYVDLSGRAGNHETCDDGNLTDGDGCDSTCAVEPGYLCDGRAGTCERIP